MKTGGGIKQGSVCAHIIHDAVTMLPLLAAYALTHVVMISGKYAGRKEGREGWREQEMEMDHSQSHERMKTRYLCEKVNMRCLRGPCERRFHIFSEQQHPSIVKRPKRN